MVDFDYLSSQLLHIVFTLGIKPKIGKNNKNASSIFTVLRNTNLLNAVRLVNFDVLQIVS